MYGIVVIAAFCFKLWLLSSVRTIATFAPHDASNFLEHAVSIVSGHWFGAYDGLALIKQPFFPIYLAFVQETGMTLAFANVCFDLLVAIVTVAAFTPLFRRAASPCIIFLVVFFEPLSLGGMRWTTDRSIINPNLALLVLACAIGLYVRRSAGLEALLRWSAGLAISLSAFWLNREDAIWIVPGLLPLGVAFVIWTVLHRRAELFPRLAVIAITPVACFLSVDAIQAINGTIYGWAITNEQQAPEFVSAYNSLARIEVPRQRYIPIPKRARELAYAVSPAARELRPSIEGADGAGWIGTTCGTTPELCATHDIGGGWAEWAFRDGAINAGHYDTAPHARAYYTRLAAEIDAACANGRLKCSAKSASIFPPPMTPDGPAAILASLSHGISVLRWLEQVGPGEVGAPAITSSLRLDYDVITRNLSDAGTHGFAGWILYNHARPPKVIGPGSSDAKFTQLASPDIAAIVGKDPRWTLDAEQNARFQLTTECGQRCFLVVLNQSRKTVTIPLRDNKLSFNGEGISLNIDASRYIGQFDNDTKYAITGNIIACYRAVFLIALPLGIVLLLIRIVRSTLKRRRRLTVDALFMAAAGISCAIYLFLLSVIDALSFQLFPGLYIGTIEAVMIVACAIIITAESGRLLRLLRRVLGRAVA
jgi:hypothetical protein